MLYYHSAQTVGTNGVYYAVHIDSWKNPDSSAHPKDE